jgi:hypothetical protein
MAKLQDLFTQARRTQGGGGMGFLGKNRSESKAHAAALVVSFPQVAAGSAEAALKAGADGLLFTWDGRTKNTLDTIAKEIDSAKGSHENLVTGLIITGGWSTFTRESLVGLKGKNIQYIILPFNAPTRILAMDEKDVEKVVTIPVRDDALYPLFIRNLSAFDMIASVLLDFELDEAFGTLTIEESLRYCAVRQALRYPAFIRINADFNEAEAYTLQAIGTQAVILDADTSIEVMRTQVQAIRNILEKVHKEDHDDTPSIFRPSPSKVEADS